MNKKKHIYKEKFKTTAARTENNLEYYAFYERPSTLLAYRFYDLTGPPSICRHKWKRVCYNPIFSILTLYSWNLASHLSGYWLHLE